MDSGHEKTEHLLDLTERKIKKLYGQAAKELEEKLQAYTKRHLAKAAEMADKYAEGKITLEQYQAYLKGGFTGEHYKQLLETLSSDLANADKIAMSIVGDYMPEAYAINHNYAMYQLAMGGVDVSGIFTLYDRRTVQRLINGKKTLLPPPRVDIPKDKQWNKQHIRQAITQGVLQGESIPKIAKRLQAVTDMDRRAAIRNARTAMTGAQNAGRVASYRAAKNMGVRVMNEWLATHDGRTRESHLQIEGERAEIGEEFSNGCEYPGDPDGEPEEVYNCRCTLIPYLPDYDDIEYDNNVSFEEWEEEQAVDNRAAMEAAIKNAKQFSPAQHETMNFSQTFWEDTLTQAEREGITRYTGSAYTRMNEYLRGQRADLDEHFLKLIEGCKDALAKASVAEDTVLYRGMGSTRTLARSLGISGEELSGLLSSGGLNGLRFVEKGFCSTGVERGAGWSKEVMLRIVAPKGTQGMYVDPISRFRGERELLLQRGTIFEIYDVIEKSGKYILKVVVAGVETL